LALAFYKVNKKPFINTVEAAFKYFIGEKLYVWRKEPIIKKPEAKNTDEAASVYVPRLSDSRLKDLTWSLDINEHLNPGTKETLSAK
jgi:hypothetical protein